MTGEEKDLLKKYLTHRNVFAKKALWLPRTIPMTIGIVVLLCTIHGLAGLEGNIESLRAKWGHDPRKPLSWFTHAFLHTDNGHLTFNTFPSVDSGLGLALALQPTRIG